MKFTEADKSGNKWEKKQATINAYIGLALDIYFAKSGQNPVMEGSKEIE